MIKFFRKIRQGLLTENKFGKPSSSAVRYLIYAIGEIILVVIGILIALQIDNSNQKKLQDKAFKTTIEQIYTHLHSAKEVESWDIAVSEEQLELCRKMQYNIDSFSNFEILRNAHYLDWIPGTGTRLLNYNDHLNKIDFDPNDRKKSSLVFHLNQFFILIIDALDHDYMNIKEKYFEPIFKEYDMPLSTGQVTTNINRAEVGDFAILSDYAIQIMDSIKNKNKFESALKSTEQRLTRILWILNFRKNENEAIREMLLRYDPELHLKYDNIILTGTALPENNLLPMRLIDKQEGIWTITSQLNEGSIRFKSTYANYFSWGGTDEEIGKLKFWGEPIGVDSGNYEIIINLEEMTYKLKKE